ncbi:hypothetical protein BLNAU_731 [Blattamonas nauphoetae]|uniref:Uncharacterized protein n=1 Tax=Blattamonas nauphoetae TaxID=2049346 RepID=A0ABQ9YKB3_9EUKA|nr:hypothetical protein BLNAU_731 [Blattamonas nauphoetae]
MYSIRTFQRLWGWTGGGEGYEKKYNWIEVNREQNRRRVPRERHEYSVTETTITIDPTYNDGNSPSSSDQTEEDDSKDVDTDDNMDNVTDDNMDIITDDNMDDRTNPPHTQQHLLPYNLLLLQSTPTVSETSGLSTFQEHSIQSMIFF